DPPETIECGVISGVYATVDFGERGLLLADEYFKIQADANKKRGGPRVDSEFYTGWYRTWGEKGIERDSSASVVLELTEKLCNMNASFNYYMFHGGTNFGFWNGAEYAAGDVCANRDWIDKNWKLVRLRVRDNQYKSLDQAMGFVKYSVRLNVGGSELDCSGVKDFGYVFVNRKFE
ncbi:hypothetical protein TELCIR_20179, partial [Teladorsagia circumcincta]